MKDFNIDLVYLWVNGEDPYWQKKYRENSSQKFFGKNRFRDNSELRYSLRSVARNMSWVNKIFIVTDEQKPSWLKDNSKIQFVDHKDIIEKDFLPCFNSEAIELNVYKIKGLSERFILASDDLFVFRPVPKSFFFDSNGDPIHRLIKTPNLDNKVPRNLYYQNLLFTKSLLREKGYQFPEDVEPYHNFEPYKVSTIKKVHELFSERITTTIANKFRSSNSVQRFIYSLMDLPQDSNRLRTATEEESIYFSIADVEKVPDVLKTKRPFLFCINDDERSDQNSLAKFPQVLEALFPEKAIWEVGVKLEITPFFESRNSICLVFAPDNNYCKYFSATLKSLISCSRQEFNYDIVVLHTDINDYSRRLLNLDLPKNFSLRFIDISTYLYTNFNVKDFNVRSYWSISTYFKCFIPLIFKNYERVLFCDADLVFADDFTEFYFTDFERKLVVGILDTIAPNLVNHPHRVRELRDLKILSPDSTYFNAGVILFNLNGIDRNKYQKTLKETLKLVLPFQDQDLLNFIFQHDVKLASPRFNFQNGVTIYNPQYLHQVDPAYAECYLAAFENPAIIHYTGSIKPWHDPYQKLSFYFWKFAKQGPFYEQILSDLMGKSSKQSNNKLKNFVREKSKVMFPLHSKRREMIKKTLKRIGLL